MSETQYTVKSTDKGIRIDKLISSINKNYSRTQIKTWFEQGLVLVNNKTVKPNYKCQEEDKIEWEIPKEETFDILPKDIPIDIIYEDKDILVINKRSGMVIHPAAGHYEDTLVNALLYHCKELSDINGTNRPGIVHRIDKDTSGLIVVAKNNVAHEGLVTQLKEKQVRRSYKAIVHGEIPHDFGTIDAPIGRSEKNRQLMDIVDDGKEATTHFEVLERLPNEFSYLQCILETGRTHQIRVHMKYIGYPIVGDPKYGQRKSIDVDGQALHAYHLQFIHPITQKELEFEAPLPPKFVEVLENIRNNY